VDAARDARVSPERVLRLLDDDPALRSAGFHLLDERDAAAS
jgi:hypothetical protein